MALNSSFNSYPPTMTKFIPHWNSINTKRGTPLVLKNGETLNDLSDLREEIQNMISAANVSGQNVKDLALDRKDKRVALRMRMGQFLRAKTYYLEDKNYARKVKSLPQESAGDTKYFDVADSIVYAWEKANAEGVPVGGIILDGGYGVDDFRTDCDLLRRQPIVNATASLGAANVRDDRNDLLLPARRMLKLYGNAIRMLYPPDSDEVKSLPQLWSQNEPDPDAPKLKVIYNEGSDSAQLMWTLAVDPDLRHIYVMISPGARYTEKSARLLADLAPLARSYELPPDTIAPYSTNWIKVLSVDDVSAEAASNAVKIAREE